MSILLFGLSSAVMIAAHAIPSQTETGVADFEVHEFKQRFRSDLQRCSQIAYAQSGQTVRLTLSFDSTGTLGEPGAVLYEFIGAAEIIRRRADAGDYEIVLDDMSRYSVTAAATDGDVEYIALVMQIDSTIQQYFEFYIRTPRKPSRV